MPYDARGGRLLPGGLRDVPSGRRSESRETGMSVSAFGSLGRLSHKRSIVDETNEQALAG